MKIFITGASGFIGKYVTEELKKENQLFLLEKDLKDLKIWKQEVIDFKPETAIHLAWEAIPDYGYENSRKNLGYGLDLLELLFQAKCQNVIMPGSCWEKYPQPFNAFSAAKTALHWLGKKFCEEKGINFVWARFFFVYGKGQKESSLIPYLLKCKKENQTPELKNPFQKSDFIHVEDVAKAVTMLVKKRPLSGEYDIGSGTLTSAAEVAGILFPGIKIKAGEQKTSDNPLADISKIKNEIGWAPSVTLEEGVKKMLN